MMDKLVLDENMERLNRFYYKREFKKKLTKLTEYYKFHTEIPRLFMLPVVKVVNSHHNRKRRLKYYEVLIWNKKGQKINELTSRRILN